MVTLDSIAVRRPTRMLSGEHSMVAKAAELAESLDDKLKGLGFLSHDGFVETINDRLKHGYLSSSVVRTARSLALYAIRDSKSLIETYGQEKFEHIVGVTAECFRKTFPNSPIGYPGVASYAAVVFSSTFDEDMRGLQEAVTVSLAGEDLSSLVTIVGVYQPFTEATSEAGSVFTELEASLKDLLKKGETATAQQVQAVLAAKAKKEVEDSFEVSLSDGRLHPHFQPIVRVATGEIADVEVLCRWDDNGGRKQDPWRGKKYHPWRPDVFIQILEELGRVRELDLAMLKCTCEACQELEKKGRPYPAFSVNLSSQDLDEKKGSIVGEVVAILDSYGIDHHKLSVEVTESSMEQSEAQLRKVIKDFHNEGVEVWLDDFGSGYSSLNRLKGFQFDVLKIDQVFIRPSRDRTEKELEDEKNKQRVILANVVRLANQLGVEILVEGVETEEDVNWLKSLGVGRIQGWYFSKDAPVPGDVVNDAADAENRVGGIESLASRQFCKELDGWSIVDRSYNERKQAKDYSAEDGPACILLRTGDGLHAVKVNEAMHRLVCGNTDVLATDSDVALCGEESSWGFAVRHLIERCRQSQKRERYLLDIAGGEYLIQAKQIGRSEDGSAESFFVTADRTLMARLPV